MAAPYKQTITTILPTTNDKFIQDSIFWKNFEFPITRKEHGQIRYIDFCKAAPYNFAVTFANKVQIFNSRGEPVRAFTRFKDNAYCGTFRNDSKLLVAGDEEGNVRLFDVAGKSQLRMFKGHQGGVHVTKFTDDNKSIWSGGDDKKIIFWDIASESKIRSYDEHLDYIRCGVSSQNSNSIILTGSYDHTAKIFDMRNSGSILTVNHGHQVESVLMYPTGSMFVTAGGNVVKVWDALAGGKLIASFSNHHKTISALSFCNDFKRILSAGIDRQVKIYDTSLFNVVHTLDYPSPILSLGISGDDSTLVVGMNDGLLSVQNRKATDVKDFKQKQKRRNNIPYKFALQADKYEPKNDDMVIEHRRKTQLMKFDRFLKKFEHSKALDAAMDIRVRTRTPEVVINVFQELIRRGALRSALGGRDPKSVCIIIKFIQKNMCNQSFTSILIDVANILTDIYKEDIGSTAAIDEHLMRLNTTVKQELEYLKELFETIGAVETLFAASQTHVYQSSISSLSQPTTTLMQECPS